MRIHLITVLFIFIGSTILFQTATSAAKVADQAETKKIRIGFHFYKPGNIYDEAYQGIIDGLNLAGVDFESVIYHSGRDPKQAAANLQKLDQMNLGVIISFSSAGTRIASSLSLNTPILASVINHPIILGIEKNKNTNSSNISGTSYYIEAEAQLSLYLKHFDKVSKVGMIYDRNNPAGYLAEEPLMRAACEEKQIEFISIGATGREDLVDATQTILNQEVAFIVIPTNLQIYDNLDIVLNQTTPHNTPVFSMNKQGVEAGALAALYADTYKNGRQMVHLIRRLLVEKEQAESIPFYYTNQPDLIINLQAAAKLDFEFEPAILGTASIVLN